MKLKMPKNLGMMLLAVWLILAGVIPLLALHFSGLTMIMAIVAIVAGVLILLNK